MINNGYFSLKKEEEILLFAFIGSVCTGVGSIFFLLSSLQQKKWLQIIVNSVGVIGAFVGIIVAALKLFTPEEQA